MKARLLHVFLIFCCAQIFWGGEVWGQTFTSNQNGNWTTAGIWTRSNYCGSGQQNDNGVNYPAPAPTGGYYPICQIDIIVTHNVNFNAGSAFGAGYFKSLSVSNAAILNFPSNFTVSTSGPAGGIGNPIFRFLGGSTINVVGTTTFTQSSIVNIVGGTNFNSSTFTATGGSQIIVDGSTVTVDNLNLSNGSSIQVINGGKLVVRNNLTTSGSASQIDVDATSSIAVTNDITIEAGHTFNLAGNLSSKNLTLNTAKTTFLGSAQVSILNDLKVNSNDPNALFSLSGSVSLSIARDLISSGSASFTSNGNSTISTGRNFYHTGSGNFNFNNTTKLTVLGNFENGYLPSTTQGGGGTIRFSNDSHLEVTGNLVNSNGSFYADGNNGIAVRGNLTQSSGQFAITNNADLAIGGSFSLQNGILQSSENSQIQIAGNANQSGGTLNSSEFSDIRINGNLTSTGGTFNGSGNSFLGVNGNHSVTNHNSPYNLNNNAQIQVNGTTTSPWNSLNVYDSACYKSSTIAKGNACVLCGETYNAEGTFRVPPGVTEITIEAVGGGGAGGSINNAIRGTGGGGGGAYSRRVLTVSPGQLLFIYIGQGATSTNGTSQAGGTSFVSLEASIPSPTAIANSIVFARGGQSTASNVSPGSPGGIALSGTELTSRPRTVSYPGGNGANNSGGGGSAGANNANGNNGGSPNPGADPIGPGGVGGMGSYSGRGSSPANGMGGGGGGSLTYNVETIIGAHGANGGVVIGYTCPKVEACSRVVNFGSNGNDYIIEYFCPGTWVAPEGLKEFGITTVGGGGGGASGPIAYGGRGGQISSTSGLGNYSDINKKGTEALGFPSGTIFNVSVGTGGNGGTGTSNGLAGHPSSVTGSFVDYSGNTISYNHIALGGNGGSSSFTPTENGLSIPASVPQRRPALAGIYGASGGSTIAPAAGTGGVGIGNNNGPGSPATRNSGSGGGGGTTGGGAGGSGKVFIYYPVFRILPVEFLSFTATYQSDTRSGLLNWTTAKEWENSHFEIERAVNSVNTWETIGRAEGSGYSDQPLDYAYEDTNLPPAGGNIFYRLKQHDLDGDVSFSDIKSIRVGAMSGTSLWRVFPNPTTGNRINLEILDCGLYHDEPITVRIISASGQFDIIESKAGSPLNELLSERLTNKSAGVYTLEISWGIQREYHKILLTR